MTQSVCQFCTRPASERGICSASECIDKALAPKIAATMQRGRERLAEIERKEREAPPLIDWEARAKSAEVERDALAAIVRKLADGHVWHAVEAAKAWAKANPANDTRLTHAPGAS